MRDLNRWIMTFWHNCIFLNVNAHDGPPSWKYHGAACGWLVNCGPPKPDTASPVSWFKGIVSELSGFSESTPLQSVTVEHHLIHDSTPRPRTPSHTHTNTHTHCPGSPPGRGRRKSIGKNLLCTARRRRSRGQVTCYDSLCHYQALQHEERAAPIKTFKIKLCLTSLKRSSWWVSWHVMRINVKDGLGLQ